MLEQNHHSNPEYTHQNQADYTSDPISRAAADDKDESDKKRRINRPSPLRGCTRRGHLLEDSRHHRCVSTSLRSYFWLIPVIQTRWKHTHMHVTHTPMLVPFHPALSLSYTHTCTHAHTHTQTLTAVHTFTVLIRTKNWNTNNTTIETLFSFRNSYSYVLYSVERQLSFNKWTWFSVCISKMISSIL